MAKTVFALNATVAQSNFLAISHSFLVCSQRSLYRSKAISEGYNLSKFSFSNRALKWSQNPTFSDHSVWCNVYLADFLAICNSLSVFFQRSFYHWKAYSQGYDSSTDNFRIGTFSSLEIQPLDRSAWPTMCQAIFGHISFPGGRIRWIFTSSGLIYKEEAITDFSPRSEPARK